MYKLVNTKERLPQIGGYYAIKTDRIYGNVHWSPETKKWTLEDGAICDSDYPNYWLEEINLLNINNGTIQRIRSKKND